MTHSASIWLLLGNEWRFYRVQPLVWLALALAVLFSYLVQQNFSHEQAQPLKALLLQQSQLLMTVQPLLIGALAPLAFLRDSQYRFAGISAALPLSRLQWCCSRAAGLFVLALLAQLGMLLTTVGAQLQIPAGSAASLSVAALLSWLGQLLLLQQLPALCWLVALQLWASRYTQRLPLLYLTTAVVWLGYMLVAAATGSPLMANSQSYAALLDQLMYWLDPYALTPWLAQLAAGDDLTPGTGLLVNRGLLMLLAGWLCWLAWRQPRGQQTRAAGNSSGWCQAKCQPPRAQPSKQTTSPATTSLRFQPAAVGKAATSAVLLTLCRVQLHQLLRQRSSWLALAAMLLITATEVFSGLSYSEPFSELTPTNLDALNRVCGDVLPRFGLLLLAWWASQLSWLNRQHGFDALQAVAPVTNLQLMTSRLLTLQLLGLGLAVLGIASVALAYWLHGLMLYDGMLDGGTGREPLAWLPYLQSGLLLWLPWLAWIPLLLACHAWLRTPLAANALVALLLTFALSTLPQLLGLNHPLWQPGFSQFTLPDSVWGYQGAFGADSPPANILGTQLNWWFGSISQGGFWPYQLFWSLLAASVWLAAVPTYHRESGQYPVNLGRFNVARLNTGSLKAAWLKAGWRFDWRATWRAHAAAKDHRRMSASKHQPSASGCYAAALLLAGLTLWQGLHIHQQLQAADALQSQDERLSLRARYEQQYLPWQAKAQPTLTHLKVQAQLNPPQQSAELTVQLTLQNQQPLAIRQILFGYPSLRATPAALASLTASVPVQIQTDTTLSQQVLTLSKPLAPSASITVQLQLSQQQLGSQSLRGHQMLRPEFSYLRLSDLLPQVGFIPQLRIQHSAERNRFGLAALPDSEQLPSKLLTAGQYDWARMDFHLQVPAGYQAIAPGAFINQSSDGQPGNQQHRDSQHCDHQHACFHYQTQQPVRNLPAIIVVPWQPINSQHSYSLPDPVGERVDDHARDRAGERAIPISIYSPQYNAATDLTLQAMQQSMQWFNRQIGPYPGDALRLVMMPDFGPSGYALPQLVLINHQLGVRSHASKDAAFSQIYRRTAHEVAHQWFGHGIGNGVAGDRAFLIESITKYAELVLLEQFQGKAAMQGLVDYERQRFARAQAGSTAAASSLLDAEESYDQYSRATLVFARLREQIGDEPILASLRMLWQQHRYPATPARALDFVRQLKAQVPVGKHPLIDQLLLGTDISLLLSAH